MEQLGVDLGLFIIRPWNHYYNSPDCLLNVYIRSSAAINAQLEQFFGLLYLPSGLPL